MSTINLKLYDLLKQDFKLSYSKAKDYAIIVQETIMEQMDEKNKQLKGENKEDLLKLEMNLKAEIKESKIDMYKAMFLTGMVQLIAILGGVLAIVKFMMGK
jgi:hypothetical protein